VIGERRQEGDVLGAPSPVHVERVLQGWPACAGPAKQEAVISLAIGVR
jgi:hypothetical protein